MDTGLKKSVVTADQLNSLLDFMKENPDLAKGLRRGRRGKLMTLKIWAACAKRLNALKPGAVKDGKGWSKYWCDWKYRVRRRALELKAAKDGNHKSEPPTPLSDIEETIINIIGENSLEHIVIKTNPLDEDSNDDMGDQNEYNNTTDGRYVTRTKRGKRRLSSRDQSDADDHSEEPCSPSKIKSSPIEDEDFESEDETSQFLKLERLKLENSYKMVTALQSVTNQLERIADIMLDIKDKILDKML